MPPPATISSPSSPASASTTPTTSAPAPAPFTTSTQYVPTLAGTRQYLRDVNALMVLLTPPVAAASGATVARFVRLATSSNRFYVLALGHFPTLRRMLIAATISGVNSAGRSNDGTGSKNSDSNNTNGRRSGSVDVGDAVADTTPTLPEPTKVQEQVLCCFSAYRMDTGMEYVPRMRDGEEEERKRVRDTLLVALEVARRYMGKERDEQGGAGTGPGSWGEVCEAADAIAGLKSDPRGLSWALGVHQKFLTVADWDAGEQRTGQQNQAAVGSLESDMTDVMQGNGKSPTKGA